MLESGDRALDLECRAPLARLSLQLVQTRAFSRDSTVEMRMGRNHQHWEAAKPSLALVAGSVTAPSLRREWRDSAPNPRTATFFRHPPPPAGRPPLTLARRHRGAEGWTDVAPHPPPQGASSMAKQAIEIEGTVIEVLPNATFWVRLKTATKSTRTSRERCANTTSGCWRATG